MTGHAGLAAPPEEPVRELLPSAGSLSCQVETPSRVFLHSYGTVFYCSQALLQCTACGRVPRTAPPTSRVQLVDACSSNHRARTTGGWIEDRVCEGIHAS